MQLFCMHVGAACGVGIYIVRVAAKYDWDCGCYSMTKPVLPITTIEVRASQLAQALERVGSLIPASQQG